jgi:hypothetical protein
MFVLTLNPGDSSFGRCSHCQNLNVLFGNPKIGNISLQFNTQDDVLDAICKSCGKKYFWSPGTIVIAKSPETAN